MSPKKPAPRSSIAELTARRRAEIAAITGMEYLLKMPDSIPDGRVLVHNRVRPTRRLGSQGFRAWLERPDPARLELCDCSWAPELGRHHRVKQLAVSLNADDRTGNEQMITRWARASDLPELLRVDECAQWLNCSTSAVRDLIRREVLPVVHIGRHHRVPREALVAYASGLTSGGPR